MSNVLLLHPPGLNDRSVVRLTPRVAQPVDKMTARPIPAPLYRCGQCVTTPEGPGRIERMSWLEGWLYGVWLTGKHQQAAFAERELDAEDDGGPDAP